MVTSKQKRLTTDPTRNNTPGQRLPVSWLITAQLSAFAILWFFMVFDKMVINEYTVCSNRIYTVDAANPHVECILVRGTNIHDVGSLGIFIILG